MVEIMKVYELRKWRCGGKLISSKAKDIINEIAEDMGENGENLSYRHTKNDLPKLEKSIESLTVADINDATTIVSFGPFIVTANEMTVDEYENLPEFDGY